MKRRQREDLEKSRISEEEELQGMGEDLDKGVESLIHEELHCVQVNMGKSHS